MGSEMKIEMEKINAREIHEKTHNLDFYILFSNGNNNPNTLCEQEDISCQFLCLAPFMPLLSSQWISQYALHTEVLK
jgi:hypothetical protein